MLLNNEKQITEFELQALIYNILIDKGFEVRGEITDTQIKIKSKNMKGFRQCRFDLVIFEEGIGKIIIEVKKPGKSINKNTRQYKKYSMYGLPVLFINDIKKVSNLISNIKQYS